MFGWVTQEQAERYVHRRIAEASCERGIDIRCPKPVGRLISSDTPGNAAERGDAGEVHFVVARQQVADSGGC